MPGSDSTLDADATLADRLGRDSDAYERYVAGARGAEASIVEDAVGDWLAFVRQSHGDAVDALPDDRSTEALVYDWLYYDFLLERLFVAVERAFDVRVRDRAPGAYSGALDADLAAVHDAVADDDLRELVDADLAAAIGATPEAFSNALGPDALRRLYEAVVSRSVRLALGEYYTPRGVAALAVETLDDAVAVDTYLDPGCGSGAFLSVLIERVLDATADAGLTAGERLDRITESVFGIDLNPVAVRSATLSYVVALAPLLAAPAVDTVSAPVFLTDALGLTRDDEVRYRGERFEPTVDHLVGNPPWITWSDLPEAVQTAWREGPAERLDLAPGEGATALLGHANDDISVPFVLTCADRYLAADGDAAFVLKRTIAKGPAGRRLRAQRLDDQPLSVRHVHDFTDLRPFGNGVRAGAAIYALSAGDDPRTPVPATAWSRDDAVPDFSTRAAIDETLGQEAAALVPVDADDPASSWLRGDADRRALGDCAHEIRHGVKDDAREVFEIDRETLPEIEPDRVFPYLKSRHVVKYGLFGHDRRLVPQDQAGEDNADRLERECPRTYDYLDARRDRLEDRSSSWLDRGPFYSVFGLGEYTWAEYKVVWCRLGYKPHFAVVSTVEDEVLGEKPVVPGDHCMFVGTDDEREAHVLCALLNSAIYQRSLDDIVSEGKSSLSKSVVSRLYLPAIEDVPDDLADRLAEGSRRAHEIVPEHTDVSKRAYNSTTIEELEPIRADLDAAVEELLARRDD
ncbi:N-6 DNA Methylase [Natronoarchaeum philippinense]|uniref:site-specific DNA-methyltransferase (adenine-specific) n=1 Tax=Natronoarchaeum philippinense TaxID=558529 RepID=A0A285N6H5_NATPI|nr:N-6 DNA methylase [Natronoarchaeum philippinense]SNZ05084.1 N-6 DNA Methylase [Natronoarchaeum philippinense]